MLFKNYGIKILFLSLIVVAAQGASNSNVQNPGPHGLGAFGQATVLFSNRSILGRINEARVVAGGGNLGMQYATIGQNLHQDTTAFNDYERNDLRVRSVDSFLNTLQRRSIDGPLPAASSFWKNFLLTGGIPVALLFGIYKMPYIKDMNAYKKAFIAGCAAALGCGFTYAGLRRLLAPVSATEEEARTTAGEQWRRIIDDKILFLNDIANKVLEDIRNDQNKYVKPIIQDVDIMWSYERKEHMKFEPVRSAAITSLAVQRRSPSVEFTQEIRRAIVNRNLQQQAAHAPQDRAYLAGGLLAIVGGSISAMHQLGAFNRIVS